LKLINDIKQILYETPESILHNPEKKKLNFDPKILQVKSKEPENKDADFN